MKPLFRSLFIGLLLALPTAAGAQLSAQCTRLLDPGQTPPISEYVKKVIERADNAMNANLDGPQSALDFNAPHWAQHTGDAVLRLINRELRIVQQSRDLPHLTACLHLDSLILQCEIEKVRLRLGQALDEKSVPDMLRLEDLILFLNQRLAHLLKGALEPGFEDPDWGIVRLFDKPNTVVCCSPDSPQCSAMPAENCRNANGQEYLTMNTCGRSESCGILPGEPSDALCPFNSDYSPPARNGYGCSLAVMESRMSDPMLAMERDAQKHIIDRLNLLIQESVQTPGLTFVAQARNVNGCGQRFGYCQNNVSMRCAIDEDCEGFGACLFDFNPGFVRESVRGPFSLGIDNWKLLWQFMAQREREGASRYFTPEYSTQKELQELAGTDSDPQPEQYSNNTFILDRNEQRGLRSDLSALQGIREANTYAIAVGVQNQDAQLRENLRKLADLVSKPDGIRSFVVRLAYFARRTCLYRQCGKRLEQVMRIALTDNCFPYADGSFAEDSIGNPRWKKCAQDACIPLPDTTLDPGKCRCFQKNGNDYTQVAPTASPDYCVKL